METLSDEIWDVVIAGTSLPQSLLALSLSRADLKILHVDKNDYYGGTDAGLSLDEAEEWVAKHNNESNCPLRASISRPENATSQLGPSRAYTLSLTPQAIYAKSRFLSILVSSQIHTQLEFQAVGSFYLLSRDGLLQKIPSNREDVFADDTIEMRDKRRLMNVLRFITSDQDEGFADDNTAGSLLGVLAGKFRLSPDLQAPIMALALSTGDPTLTRFDVAADRLKRHLQSVGYFGPGLGAVIAKYGSNSEITQVACRACAVGGATYLLGHGIEQVKVNDESDQNIIDVILTDGTPVKAKHIVGGHTDLPDASLPQVTDPHDAPTHQEQQILHQISVLSSPLSHLFVPLSENGTVPAAAVVTAADFDGHTPSVYLQVHSNETGECPRGQVVVYASTVIDTTAPVPAQEHLANTMNKFLEAQRQHEPETQVLWQMTYVSTNRDSQCAASLLRHSKDRLLVFPPESYDLAFDDSVLDVVREAWETILADKSIEQEFLRFEERGTDDQES